MPGENTANMRAIVLRYPFSKQFDHGPILTMKEVAISEFKAKCPGMLEEVRKTRKPTRVTRFGKPVAEVILPSPAKPIGRRLGCMAGTGRLFG